MSRVKPIWFIVPAIIVILIFVQLYLKERKKNIEFQQQMIQMQQSQSQQTVEYSLNGKTYKIPASSDLQSITTLYLLQKDEGFRRFIEDYKVTELLKDSEGKKLELK